MIGDAVVNGKPGLILVVEKFPGVSTTQVTRDVQQALETLRPGLSGIETDTSWFAPADYVAAAKSNLGLAVAIGAGLLLLALAAMRFHWRAALVGVITVPLSVITRGPDRRSARLRIERTRDRWSRRGGRHRGG